LIPFSFSTLAIVVEATRCPTSLSSPWIRRVATRRILEGQPDDVCLDCLHQPGPAHAYHDVRPLGSDQPVMPAHQRVWRNDWRHRVEHPSSQDLRFRRQTPALVVLQPRHLSAALLLQHAVLLDDVLDDVLLMAIHPARHRQEQGLKRVMHRVLQIRRRAADPVEYLTDVLSRLAPHPASRIGELTPSGWKELRAADPVR